MAKRIATDEFAKRLQSNGKDIAKRWQSDCKANDSLAIAERLQSDCNSDLLEHGCTMIAKQLQSDSWAFAKQSLNI
jgi:hypothetical protein